MKTPALAAVLACLTAAALVGPIGASSAAAPITVGTPTATTVSESYDYASEVLSDPWDFSNAADAAGPTNIAGGVITYNPSAQVQPTLVASVASSQPWGKDGRIYTVDPARYTKLSLRLWSSATSSGGISWTHCSWATTSCRGFQAFTMKTGWNTYDLTLAGSGISSAPAGWPGAPIIGFRLTGASGPTVKVDWARLHAASAASTSFDWTDPTSSRTDTVYWDGDSDQSNNTSTNPNWGVVETVVGDGSPHTTNVDLSAYPPGDYRFYVTAGADTSASTSAVTVVPRPRPVVSKPNASNGADYATTVRRDPWDFANSSDYLLTNAKFLGTNRQWIVAENTNNDPRVGLAVPSAGFAGSAYHRLQIHVALIGTYGLGNVAGEGCVGRFMWTTASGGVTKWQTTDDLVLYPGWNSVNLDMATSPSNAIVDPAIANRIGWAGQTITRVRFDPNEDPGKRQWYLDDVKISTDPASSAGQFDVQFSDGAGVPGTTAQVEAVLGSTTLVVASGIPVQPGVNTYVWHPAHSVAAGTYRMRVVLTNSAGSVARWAGVPIRMIPA